MLVCAIASWGAAQADQAVPVPGWDPNRDRPFIEQYIRRELSLELERVDPRRGIAGSLRNSGSKTLIRARVLLTFYGPDGGVSGEYEFSGLPWAGPLESSAPGSVHEKPLGPGGVREFLVYPSAVAEGWSPDWKAEISSITFAPEPSS